MRTLQEILDDIQQAAECLPCGGIGANGATLDELNEAARCGRNMADDAMYHQGQLIWLLAQEGIKTLKGEG